jgi:hypothetical protein
VELLLDHRVLLGFEPRGRRPGHLIKLPPCYVTVAALNYQDFRPKLSGTIQRGGPTLWVTGTRLSDTEPGIIALGPLYVPLIPEKILSLIKSNEYYPNITRFYRAYPFKLNDRFFWIIIIHFDCNS